mmetsp:Transcript_3998/g.10840  ORF Transcript_3998/g.10840 Transcript_3998/m.10840 type:complete len:169 (+) Transcript_3998:176-682(+)
MAPKSGARDAQVDYDASTLLRGGHNFDVRISCSGACGGDDMAVSVHDFSEPELDRAISRARATGMPPHLWRLTACCIKCCVVAEETRQQEAEHAKLEKQQQLVDLGVRSLNVKEDSKLNDSHTCWACKQSLDASAFTRKMLTKPPAKRRCQPCTVTALAAEEAQRAAK